MKRFVLNGALVSILLALTLIGGTAFGMIWPVAPKSTSDLRFVGYVSLPSAPGAGWLSFLDYLSIQGRFLFVPSIGSGNVYRIALGSAGLPSARDVVAMPGAAGAHGVAYDTASKLSFVSRRSTDTVDVFDAREMKVRARIPVGEDADGVFSDPANGLLYVAQGAGAYATLIDPKRQMRVGTIALGGAPEFAVFDPATRHIYQNLSDTNVIAVVDTAKRAVVERWPLAGCGGPTGMALDMANRRLFIVCKDQKALAVLDIGTHKVVATVPIGGGPDSVAYDPVLHRVYTAGSSGTLSIIGQYGTGDYRKLGDIQLSFGAHTLAVDPVTHRVYVGCATLFVSPRLAVFAP